MLEKLDTKLGPVVVLNDFFLDRIISVSDIGNFYNQIMEKINLGGSIRGIPQKDLKGGNATNVAYALARLGCPVSLVTISDKAGSVLLKDTFSGFDNASLYVIDGKPGRTTALEFQNGNNIVNIMLSDLGDNENFGPDKLGRRELDALVKSEAVIVTNWASNKRGTELAKFAFKKSRKAIHLMDPADIQSRAREFKEDLFMLGPDLDSLCINENEFNIMLKQHGLGKVSETGQIKNLVLELAKKYSISIDLHTDRGSFWTNGKDVEFARSFPAEPLLVTGAGDVWDAANIIGYLAKQGTHERLLFANAAASLYIESSDGIPPTRKEVLRLLSK